MSERINLSSGIMERFLREVVFEVMKIKQIHRGQKESKEMGVTKTGLQKCP